MTTRPYSLPSSELICGQRYSWHLDQAQDEPPVWRLVHLNTGQCIGKIRTAGIRYCLYEMADYPSPTYPESYFFASLEAARLYLVGFETTARLATGPRPNRNPDWVTASHGILEPDPKCFKVGAPPAEAPPEPKLDWASIRGFFPDRRRWVLRVILADNRFVAGRITELRRAPLGESVYAVRPLYGWVRNNWKGRPDCYLYLSDAKAALEAATRDAIKANTPAPTTRPSSPPQDPDAPIALLDTREGRSRLVQDCLKREMVCSLEGKPEAAARWGMVAESLARLWNYSNGRANPPK
jgi:hypothetical protein